MKKFDFDELVDRRNTHCVKYDILDQVFGQNDMIPMWVADMDFKTPECIIKAIKQRLEHEILGYTIRSHSYYEAIQSWMLKRHNWNVEKEWITFSPGVVSGLAVSVLAFTKPGDGIIIQPPVYTPFHSVVEENQRHLIYNPLKLVDGRLQMDFNDLEACAREGAKMLILSNPHNPGGNVWKIEELKAMGEICSRHNLMILSDEIHSDIVFKPNKHIPLVTVSDDLAKRSIILMAPSKTFNTAGLSSSVIIIPDEKIRKTFNAYCDTLHLSLGNIFGSVALEAAYRDGEEWLEALLVYFEENINFTLEFFHTHLPNIKPVRPEGTYMIWLDCQNTGFSHDALQEFMIKKAKVGLNEGSMFGPGGEGFMRMNVACPRSILEKALNQIKGAFQNKG